MFATDMDMKILRIVQKQEDEIEKIIETLDLINHVLDEQRKEIERLSKIIDSVQRKDS